MTEPEASGVTEPKTTFNVADLSPVEGYKLGSGLVVPRPIGWIGTRGTDGSENLAPYSFFNMVSGDPPTFLYSPGPNPDGPKGSLRNAEETRLFSINIVTAETVEAMNATAATVPHGESEFGLAGVTSIPGPATGVPTVAEATATIECRVTQFVKVGREGGGNVLVIGEAVAFHVADRILDGTRVDQAGLRAVGRHVGNTYSNATDLFDIVRPA